MPEPASGVQTVRIVVGPMHDASPFVPFVLAPKLHRILLCERDPRRNVDIMTHEQGVVVLQADDESLVSRALQVIA